MAITQHYDSDFTYLRSSIVVEDMEIRIDPVGTRAYISKCLASFRKIAADRIAGDGLHAAPYRSGDFVMVKEEADVWSFSTIITFTARAYKSTGSFYTSVFRDQVAGHMAINGLALSKRYHLSPLGEKIMSKEFWETGAQFPLAEEASASTSPKAFVLVDGDLIAYRVSAAADGRYYAVNGERFKYSKDAKSYCDKRSLPNDQIVQGFEPEPVENALRSVASMLEELKLYFINSGINPIIKICLSCSRNFRYDIFPDYKKSRVGVRKPEHLAACKEYLVKQFGAYVFEPFEADDLIAMLTTQLSAAQQRVVIASTDKDFTQLGRRGVQFLDVSEHKMWEVSEQEAETYFWKQILMGDSSDDIPGLPKVGPQTAIKILMNGGIPQGEEIDRLRKLFYVRTLEAYMALGHKTADEARAAIQLAGNLLWLVRDETKAGKWELPE